MSVIGVSAATNLVPLLVEHEVGEAEHVAGQLADLVRRRIACVARDDLGEAERLRHVVVAAGAQRLDLVLDAVLRGQEEDGGLEPARPQAAPDLDPLDVREHPVEHDEVRAPESRPPRAPRGRSTPPSTS